MKTPDESGLRSRFLRALRSGVLLAVFALSVVHGRAEEPLPFLMGADVSLAPTLEKAGVVFKDGGQPADILAIFRAHGANCIRLRLFVHPHPEGKDAEVNDLPYTLAIAKRVKAAGLRFCLDLHYSDVWAEPSHQQTPAGWPGPLPMTRGARPSDYYGFWPHDLERICNVARMARQVQDYTTQTLQAFREAGAVPDVVQIGHGIDMGILWPVGELFVNGLPKDLCYDQLAALLQAGVQGVREGTSGGPMPRIMLHVGNGGIKDSVQRFFDQIVQRGVTFDLIGLGFYPYQPGGTLADLRQTLEITARLYGKPVVVVETAYLNSAAPWLDLSSHPGMTFPQSPDGQRDYLQALIKTVHEAPDGLGAGVLYWYPESMASLQTFYPGAKFWWGGKAALFDQEGSALPAFAAFGKP